MLALNQSCAEMLTSRLNKLCALLDLSSADLLLFGKNPLWDLHICSAMCTEVQCVGCWKLPFKSVLQIQIKTQI